MVLPIRTRMDGFKELKAFMYCTYVYINITYNVYINIRYNIIYGLYNSNHMYLVMVGTMEHSIVGIYFSTVLKS